MELRFCYRISKEANMAFNLETGAPEEAYFQVKMKVSNIPEDYEKSHQAIGRVLAKQGGCDPEWVIPISTEDYDRHDQEDDES
jgi:hypothetical protein